MLYNDPQFLEGRQPEENTESEKSDKTESNEVTEEKPVKETKAPEASEPKKASFKKHQLLDEEYTFDTFIPGDNSRFAYNAAIAVANEPGKSITTRNFWRVVNLRNLQLLLIAFSAAFLSVSFRYYGFPWQKIIADIIANEFFEKIEKFCLIGFKRFKGIRNFRKF